VLSKKPRASDTFLRYPRYVSAAVAGGGGMVKCWTPEGLFLSVIEMCDVEKCPTLIVYRDTDISPFIF